MCECVCKSLSMSVGVGGLGSFNFLLLILFAVSLFLLLFLISVRHFELLFCMKSAIQIKIDWFDDLLQSHSPIICTLTSKTWYMHICITPYLIDPTDFSNKLRDCHVNYDLLCTIDVYPSIPLKIGLDAMYYFLNQRVELHPWTEFLLLLTDEVLTKKYFMFINAIFNSEALIWDHQQLPIMLICLWVKIWFGQYLKSLFFFLKSYWRHIDDLFLIWSGNRKDLKSLFFSLINEWSL